MVFPAVVDRPGNVEVRMSDIKVNGGRLPAGGDARNPSTMIRWRWYHFYFVLAMFDVVVIAASLIMYHRTIQSFSVALNELHRVDEGEAWVGNIRLAVLHLNAPGNDVFATRLVEQERARFERSRTRYRAMATRDAEFGLDLAEFRARVDEMFGEEQRVFGIFASINEATITPARERRLLNEATSAMASMDRHQAKALEALALVAQGLSDEEHRLLDEYRDALQHSASIEKYMFAMVVIILIGVFWYGRKLQQTYEQMMLERQRVAEEKHARLAAVGEVCAAVAHGIRNPLAAITSSAQLALEFGTADEQTKLRMQDVLYESRRLAERVTRLLGFSSPREGRFERCDVDAIIQGALDEIRPSLEESRVRVETDFRDQPLAVRGDSEWLTQAIIEVVSNSMEHMSSGGRITVACGRDDREPRFARIDITDDGSGIPETIRTRVFDLFFTSKAEGNGIGLASVKRVMDMHAGRVCAADTKGRGARIEMLLPLE